MLAYRKEFFVEKIHEKNTGSYSIITANISLIDAHCFFLVGVDFYDERSKNKNSVKESIRFYLLINGRCDILGKNNSTMR